MIADQTARLFLDKLAPGSRILDVGAGPDGDGFGQLARDEGHQYVPLDVHTGENWETHLRRSHYKAYDGLWMSHSLEHMLNTQTALKNIRQVMKGEGWIGITVPPRKDEIVGGHVSLWNAGLLLYRLILAGFDCSEASVKTYGYNCSVILRRRWIPTPPLNYDRGDIEKLEPYWPNGLDCRHGFNGMIREHNWR